MPVDNRMPNTGSLNRSQDIIHQQETETQIRSDSEVGYKSSHKTRNRIKMF